MENKEYLILIIDDDDDSVNFVSYNLKKEGYQVISANSGEEGIRLAKAKKPHLILLDVTMPEMDGIETCLKLRQEHSLKNAIIAFFTARIEDYSQISGFEAGADDYITKPVKPRVLVTKIQSLLRRHKLNSVLENKTNKVGDLIVDSEKRMVYLSGKPISLPKKEFDLLSLLTSKPDKVFSRSEIYNHVWHDDAFVDDKTINVHIRKIREKLGNDNIKTIKKVGFKYELR